MKNYHKFCTITTNSASSVSTCCKVNSNIPYVMKRVKCENKSILDKCLEELSVISKVDSTNIATYIDSFIHNNKDDEVFFCFVMKKYEMDLEQYLKTMNEPLEQTVKYNLLK